MTRTKCDARNATIAAFDAAVMVLRGYLETYPDAEERQRLMGVDPALRNIRRHFEIATMDAGTEVAP